MFEIKTCLVGLFFFVGNQRPQQEWAHAGVQVLTQLEGDFDILF